MDEQPLFDLSGAFGYNNGKVMLGGTQYEYV